MRTRKINGRLLREARDELGLPLVTLADRAGISKGYLASIELYGWQPRPVVRERICTAIAAWGVDRDTITYVVGDPEPTYVADEPEAATEVPA